MDKKTLKEQLSRFMSFMILITAACLLLIGIVDFSKKELTRYTDYNKNFTEYFKDATKRWFWSKEKYEKDLNERLVTSINEFEKILNNEVEFIENLCYAVLLDKKINKDIAQKICPCVGDKIPVKHIEFLKDNLKQMDFLIYKGDKDAVEANEAFFDKMKECLKEYENEITKNN